MATEKLPAWGYYAIGFLAASLMLSLGANGTLLVQDRNSIAKTLEKFESIMDTQNRTIAGQTVILNKICLLLPLDHKTRSEHLKNYPFGWPDRVK